MKTLADFKRAMVPGTPIKYLKLEERKYSDEHQDHQGEWRELPIPEKLRGTRYVSYADTTGFYLKQEDDKSARGSFCGFPKAADLALDGDRFTITERSYKGTEYQKRHYQIVRYS